MGGTVFPGSRLARSIIASRETIWKPLREECLKPLPHLMRFGLVKYSYVGARGANGFVQKRLTGVLFWYDPSNRLSRFIFRMSLAETQGERARFIGNGTNMYPIY